MARIVGDYTLGVQLGRGSFAVVWQGQHRVSGATVAVKEINTNLLNAKLKQSLECEVSILKRVEHRNIVRLKETLEERNRMYLVMEYCSGGDLAHYIRHCKRLPEATAHGLMVQLAAGLREMWAHNLVHRDLKPQNLLLSDTTPGAVLKIADFGFARNLQPQGLAETLCGSPLYMAPEILHFHKYDAKADLWSVGTILFELLAGRPPFTGDNHVQLLHNIEKGAPRIPTDLNLSHSCRRLLAGLLKRNPVERISFEEFFSHPWLASGPAAPAGLVATDMLVERSAGSGTSSRAAPAGSSEASTGTGVGDDLLPFAVEGDDGSTAASRAGPRAAHKAAHLMSSTRLDALMGPPTPRPADSYAQMGSRGSSTSGVRRGAPASSGGDTMDEDDYVIIDGSSIGARAAAAAAYQQPASPSSLAALRRRGLAAMWHPLAPSPPTHAPPRKPPVSPRAPPSLQQPLPQPAVRRPSASSAGSAVAAGASFHHAIVMAAPAGSYPEALEQVAGALEALAALSSQQDRPPRALALRLLALQLLQLALVAEQRPRAPPAGDAGSASAAAGQPHAVQPHSQQRQPVPQQAQHAASPSGSVSRQQQGSDDGGQAAVPAGGAATAELGTTKLASPLVLRCTAAIRSVSGHAQRDAALIARMGADRDLPDVWVLAYEGGLELSQAAAAEELLANWDAAALAYSQATAIMHFLAGEAGSLPLQPALALTGPQLARVHRYAAAISARLAAVSAHLQPSVAAPAAH